MSNYYEIVGVYPINYDEETGPEYESRRTVWRGPLPPDNFAVDTARMLALGQPDTRTALDMDVFAESGYVLRVLQRVALRREMELQLTIGIFGVEQSKVVGKILVIPEIPDYLPDDLAG